MKLFLLFSLFLSSISFSQKPAKKFLYLQNQANDKIKKINLDHSKWLSYTVDSTGDNYYTYYTRDSYSPSDCKFGKDEIEFHFNEVNYSSWLYQENVEYEDSWNIFCEDSSTILPYTAPTKNIDIYLTRQSKIGSVLFGVGVGIVYSALVNAFFVAPMLGLNNGSFEGYSTSRLLRGEFYSGIGLSIGLPLMYIFDKHDYYFQNSNGVFDEWVIVDETAYLR